jgi:uroporphyrinogen-III decarboxylase
MNREKWEWIRKAAQGAEFAAPPVALIIDSPWLPGHLGLSTLDYITVPEVWLEANLRVEAAFPEVIFLPGFWAEAGMCAEPSAFGCRISFHHDQTPVAHPVFEQVEEVGRLPAPNPRTDGLMPVLLNLYRRMEPRVNEAGHVIRVVAARGPLTVATHLMGVSNFLLGLKLNPGQTHRLLSITSTLTRNWLEAQAATLQQAEGILVLDDIAGFLSPADYLEFAHPYLKGLFAAFPGVVKIFHDDTDNVVPFRHLRDLGIHIFNFTHLQGIARVRELVGPEVCLMGNVPPLDVLARGTPEQVRQAARACVRAHGSQRGLLLSAGGGTSPGTPGANIRALVEAACETARQT